MRKTSKKISKQKESSKRKNGSSGNTKQQLSVRKTSPKNGNGKKPSRDAGPIKDNEISGMKKQYLKSNGSCNVTFRLPKEAAPDAQVVTIVGDFNCADKYVPNTFGSDDSLVIV